MPAAVARPAGAGPFPTVVLLHGTHGFAREYVELAQMFARGGFLAVAPCWFSGGGGSGSRFITPIECRAAPPRPAHESPEVLRIVGALLAAVRTLPDARSDRIGLFGHSRGGGAVRDYVLRVDDVQAAAINSAGYPPHLAERAGQLRVPILILHGEADSPADGGSEFTNVKMARAFEAALRRYGKSVDAMYYENGGHNSLFSDLAQRDDEVKRIVAFFRQHLRE